MALKNRPKFQTGDLVEYEIFGIGTVLYRNTDGRYRVRFKHGDAIHKHWCREQDLKLYRKRYNLNKKSNELYLKLTEIALKNGKTFEETVKMYINVEKKMKEERKLERWKQ